MELVGRYVNLPYALPSGQRVKLLNDNDIYLGALMELKDLGLRCGVVADAGFILICRFGQDGGEPELVAYRKR